MKVRGFKRLSIVALLALLVLPTLFLTVKPALAIPTESPDLVASDNANAIRLQSQKKAENLAKKSLSGILFSGLINLMQFAADKAAYTMATALVSGGAAGDPLVEFRTPGVLARDYFQSVGGELVGLVSEDLQTTKIGGVAYFANFNLCAPSSPAVLLSLKLGIKSMFEEPLPKCEWNAIKTNWAGFIADNANTFVGEDSILKNDAVLTQLASAFDPQTNEFSASISLFNKVLYQAKGKSDTALINLIVKGPTKDILDVVTGNVKTASQTIDWYRISQNDHIENQKYDFGKMLISNSAAFEQVGLHAASMFANTLVTSGLQALLSGQFKTNANTVDPFNAGLVALMDKETEQARLKSLYTSVPFEVTNYDALSDYANCPNSGNRGLYNCVMDTSFASAVASAAADNALTVQGAVDQGLVNGDWALIPSSDKSRDQDPYCYTYGYCYSNLVKLRKARIIPDGWEMAADSIYNSESSPVTLQTVMDGFDDCNAAGQPDESHNWCKLIDPNWILKYPDTTCKNLAYGELLESSTDATRQQNCVDAPSCISTDADGNCTGGYGYCVRESNVWQFRGDSCPDYASSCLSFTTSEGAKANYLTNTVDYGSCNADNAGCTWYATDKTVQDDGTYAWPTVTSVAEADIATDTYKTRIYYNDNVETCDASAAGCNKLVERGSDVGLNLIPNSSFETDADVNGLPDNWLSTNATAVTYDDSGVALNGDWVIGSNLGGLLYQSGIVLQQGSFYTLSYYARLMDSSDGEETANMLISLNADNGEVIDLRGTSMSTSCNIYVDGSSVTQPEVLQLSGYTTTTDYQRYTCTFTAPILTDRSATVRAYVDVGDGVNVADVWMDEIQLEQSETVTAWHDGYSTASPTFVYANVPPTYLGCTGADTDAAECADYSTVCQEQDVGCTEYTPANGDPAVFGVVSSLDTCPATCDGYDSYKQEATLYEPDGDFPVYFIPSSATTCSAADAGCDEFTKLSDESLGYFTYLRACLTPEQDAGSTYYTWEGSDATGYQLVTWKLLESDLGDSASSTYTASSNVETNVGKAPCTMWETSATGMTCDDNADGDTGEHFDTDTETCDQHDDIFADPDCREFYDTAGDIHYRLWSKTVTVNEACASYRKTDLVGLGLDSNGDLVDDGDANCTNSGGFFDDTLNECTYYGYSDESNTCAAAANGCRDYTGGRSANSRVAFTDTLETGDYTSWDSTSTANVTYSNESVATDGHSLSSLGQTVWTFMGGDGTVCVDEAGCDETAVALGGTCTVGLDGGYCGTLQDELYAGKTYTLSFWAKGTGTLTAGFNVDAVTSGINLNTASGAGRDATFGTATLSASDWQEYSLGPLNMTADDYADFGNGTVLAFIPDSSSSRFYLDNVVLREGEDSIDVIKGSWTTPTECDATPEGTAFPQYYLGCQQYTSQTGETSYEKSFSSLCSEKKVGCSAYYSTAQTDSAYGQVYGLTCSTLDGAIVGAATNCYYGVIDEDSADTVDPVYDTTSAFMCTIGVGFSSCSANMDWSIPADQLLSHLSYGPSAHVVPADAPLYLIVGDTNSCQSADAGCEEVGLPTFSPDHTAVTASTSTYLLNSPADYDTTLCSQDDLFCQAWDAGDKGEYYFKDPGNQSCEYRTGVTVNNTSYDGWFRTGTDNFCYGSGTCVTTDGSVGASCTTDAECGTGVSCNITSGSYLVGGDQSGIWHNGDPSYNNWVGTCDAGDSTCSEFQDLLQIPDGHLYGESDGTSYFFLDNSSLDESGLTTNEQCNGLVSQKAGCVLFNNTAVTAQTYNASASYVASLHADTLFGDKPNDLENPISCTDAVTSTITTPAGDSVDLCASRCAYGSYALHDANNGSTDVSDTSVGGYYAGRSAAQMASVNGLAALGLTATDLYTFGASCLSDSDCPAMTSDLGDEVDGTCGTTVITISESFYSTEVSEIVPRLEDDSNRVLKVDRDRQCSEWLSCADSQQVWDARTGTYRTICGDIDLCNAYSGTGDASFCSSWVQDDVATALDVTRYTSRDTSWYGHEYSGYAIPDLLPVQMLSQVNITPPPGYCNLPMSAGPAVRSEYQGDTCSVDADCSNQATAFPTIYHGSCSQATAADYRLVFDAGSCDESYGASCTVGYCSDTAAACSSNDQCGSNSCVIGTCYTVGSTDCVTDSDCSSGDTCLAEGKCATDNGQLDVGASCDTGETLYADLNDKTGTCINASCLLTAEGQPVDTGLTEAKDCRAYPESSSPFDNEVVSMWVNPDMSEEPNGNDSKQPFADVASKLDIAPDMVPYSFITGFDNANVCVGGVDCSCSYKKITYGTGSTTSYVSADPAVSIINQSLGICSGGGFDGAACAKSDEDTGVISEAMCERGCTSTDCSDGIAVTSDGNDSDGHSTTLNNSGDVKGGGTCNYPTQEDTILGLDGYCLERDTSINVNGNRDDAHRACLTWLPVDQLAGSTDLYGKDLSAGYFAHASVCSNVSIFMDLGPTLVPELNATVGTEGTPGGQMVACAESKITDRTESSSTEFDGTVDDVFSDDTMSNCGHNLVCPAGYWALIGQPSWADGAISINSQVIANACMGVDSAEYNDCPYVCIPLGAVEPTSGMSCDYGGAYTNEVLANTPNGVSVLDTVNDRLPDNVYAIGSQPSGRAETDSLYGYQNFDYVASSLKLCRVRGVEYTDAFAMSVFALPETTDYYRNLVAGQAVTGVDIYTFDENDLNVEYYPACAEVLNVVDSATDIGYPFTDRILNDSQNYMISDDTYSNMQYERTTTPEPFGVITTDLSARDNSDPPIIAASCADLADASDVYRNFDTIVPPLGDSLNSCDSLIDYSDKVAESYPGNALARAWVSFTLSIQKVTHGTFSVKTSMWSVLPSVGAAEEAFTRISKIFAKADIGTDDNLSTWVGEWSSDGGDALGYQTAATTSDDGYDVYDVRGAEGNPPKVWALSNSTCDGTQCEEGDEGALTLNDQNSGDLEGTGGFYRAYLKFYAAADKNQLPIRRVIVDWGDNKQSGAVDGGNFYKNHRGYQDGTTTSICDTDPNESTYEWGMNGDSCDPNYFSYNHNYTCNDSLILGMDACVDANTDGINDVSPCMAVTDEGSFCVFTPKVHVRDNWGWCTGSCVDASTDSIINHEADASNNGGAGCFDSVGTISATSIQSECNYESYPLNASNNDPWVHYQGAVYVKP